MRLVIAAGVLTLMAWQLLPTAVQAATPSAAAAPAKARKKGSRPPSAESIENLPLAKTYPLDKPAVEPAFSITFHPAPPEEQTEPAQGVEAAVPVAMEPPPPAVMPAPAPAAVVVETTAPAAPVLPAPAPLPAPVAVAAPAPPPAPPAPVEEKPVAPVVIAAPAPAPAPPAPALPVAATAEPIAPTASADASLLEAMTGAAPPAISIKPAATTLPQKRVALVIGNAAYAIAPLKNPVNDMHLISGALQRLNFEVIEVADGTQQQMREAISQFGERVEQGGIGLFYYAGHGMQVRGQNYLIPVDANITREGDVQIYGFPADTILSQMGEGSNRLNIVVLDACRDNPFQTASRSLKRGLAQLDAPAGTMVAYATSPGSVASDGDGGNGLYTQELVRQMLTANQRLEDVFINTRLAVESRSGGRQIPWENASLKSRFYFSGGDNRPAAAATEAPLQVATSSVADMSGIATPSRNLAEIGVWASMKVSEIAADIEQLYLAQFPKGKFVEEAKARIAYLGTPQAKIDKLNTGAVLPPNYFPLLSAKQAWRFGEWILLRVPSKSKARVGLLETQEKVVDVPADKDDEQLYLYYNGPKRLPALAFHFDEDGPKEDKVAMRNKESVSINDCQNDFGSFDVPEWRDLKFAEGIEFDAQPLPENFRMAFTTSDDDDSYTRLLRREGDELKVMLKGRTVTIPARQPALQYKNTERGTECTYR